MGLIDLNAMLRTLAVGAIAYVALVAMLRVSGKRTLSQLNAFDLVVTVALGSTLATILLSDDTGLAQGLVAFALLIALQFLITWSSLRSRKVARLAKSEPTMLVLRGELLTEALRRERLLLSEVEAALRQHGLATVDEAALVTLETDGSISVVPHLAPETARRLEDGLVARGPGTAASRPGQSPSTWNDPTVTEDRAD